MSDIQHAIQIAAKQEEIYPLIAAGAGFSQWWAAGVTEPEGAVELGFFKRAAVYRLRLAVDEAPARGVGLRDGQ